MNFCRNCGKELPQGAQFCGACGTPRGSGGAGASVAVGVQPEKTNGFAIASLVFGIIGLCGIGSILAVIFGFVARGRIRESAGAEKGDGLAIAGIVLGFVQMAAAALLIPAIAIPTFLGARIRAQDRAAESSLRNTVTEAKAIYTDHADYRAATPVALGQGEPSLGFVGPETDSTGPQTVSVFAPGPSVFIAAAKSKSGRCLWLRDVASLGSPDSGSRWNRVIDASRCNARFVPTTGWSFTPTF